jgi:2'-5' RNA ligase
VPRVFFAVWPDRAAADTLHRLAREASGRCGGRVMRRDSLHLTLAFLGDVPADRMADAMQVADRIAAEPFELILDRIGYWKHNRILWAGGVSPALTFLADALGDGLRAAGFAIEARPFVAHLTLLRDAHCGGEVPPLAQPIAWPVGEFVLAESRRSREGSHYEAAGRWPLGRPQVLK